MFRTGSLDGGSDSLKGYIGGLSVDNRINIPNVIQELAERETVGLEGDPLDELHIKITSDALPTKSNRPHVVGTLASKFATAEQSSTIVKKGDSEQTIILMLTALAYDAATCGEFATINGVIQANYLLSTGLPIDESKVKGARKNFGQKFKDGIHQVEFLETPQLEGVKVLISFEDVYVNSEGHAAVIDMTMSDSFKPVNTELLNMNLLLDDIGGNTTDLAVIKKGKIDNENSDGIPLGIGNTLDKIINIVHKRHRFLFKTRRELVENITGDVDPYIIRPTGAPISIKEIVDKELNSFAIQEYNQLQQIWAAVGNINRIYFRGGTSYLIKDFLTELNKQKAEYPIHFAPTADESIWAIAKAYYKLLVMKAKKAGYSEKVLTLKIAK